MAVLDSAISQDICAAICFLSPRNILSLRAFWRSRTAALQADILRPAQSLLCYVVQESFS
jgi:hypothetical protein